MHPRWRGCKVACKGELFFLPHLSGLPWPHLPGVPHFHVNRPLDCQKNNLSCASLFLCTFLCRHCMTMTSNCLISRFVEDVNRRQWLSFCFAELRYSLSEFNSWKICQHFTQWTRRNKRDQVRSSANSLFKLPSTHLLLLRVSILNVNVYAGAFPSTFQRVLVKTKLWRNIDRDLKQNIYIHSLTYVIYKRPRLFPAPLLTVVRISYRHILTSGLGNHFLFPFGSD